MDRRWEQRRAQASARRADPTASVVIKREPPPSAANELTTELPSSEHVLDDLRELEQSSSPQPFLSNTTRAMLVVVLVGNAALLALLYANGFLG